MTIMAAGMKKTYQGHLVESGFIRTPIPRPIDLCSTSVGKASLVVVARPFPQVPDLVLF
ncbi:hypothetical protein ABZ912_44320 [Nonomuraea angiospora]|uniref:hypothetical protein n=1 Tax=Nonomuraea angiospora TaxID=46172 RepID=UPI0033FA6D3F